MSENRAFEDPGEDITEPAEPLSPEPVEVLKAHGVDVFWPHPDEPCGWDK